QHTVATATTVWATPFGNPGDRTGAFSMFEHHISYASQAQARCVMRRGAGSAFSCMTQLRGSRSHFLQRDPTIFSAGWRPSHWSGFRPWTETGPEAWHVGDGFSRASWLAHDCACFRVR